MDWLPRLSPSEKQCRGTLNKIRMTIGNGIKSSGIDGTCEHKDTDVILLEYRGQILTARTAFVNTY